ncbi:hypothetical protein SLEP1_g38541 [Rubroshorea leprosula]|nr:hypothetical protein SLEP1_g38541 [Rubroshorea leprosula]
MKAYLRAFDLWDAVEHDIDPPPLPRNATLNQIRCHTEEVTKKYKALTTIHSTVSKEIFTRIMTCETTKKAWDKLKEEFHRDTKAKQIQVVNLKRKFEVLRMKEIETVKEFSDRAMKVVNHIRILGEELTEKRIVDKVLVSLPKKFEHKISSLEDSKDMTQMTLSELVNALQAVEQRKAIRQKVKGDVEGAFIANERGKGHVSNLTMMKRLGNGELVEVKGKGTITVNTSTGIKYICDVLYVPCLSQNLISVGQLLENGYVVHLHDECVDVIDKLGVKLFTAAMNHRKFSIDWSQTEIKACTTVVDEYEKWHGSFVAKEEVVGTVQDKHANKAPMLLSD